MRLLSTPILISLASLLLIDPVAALPTNESVIISTTNSTKSTLEARAIKKQTQCFTEGALFPIVDLQSYATQLETNEFDKLLFIPHGRYLNGVHGRLKVCAYNAFDKENTSVMNGVVASALHKIMDKCCDTKEPMCMGGYAQEKGQPTLYVDFVTRSSSETCNKPYD